MKLILAIFLLAVPSLINGDSNLRGDARELRDKVTTSLSWNEPEGNCTGQLCGVWGDPHIVTCDGYSYDCQGVGIFTMMKNTLWDIQGTFVTVGERELDLVESWGLTHGASVTNDIMINVTENDTDYPVVQLSFGDLSSHDGTHPTEIGCHAGYYYKKTNMKGQRRSVENTMAECRERCVKTDGCDAFSWWKDGGCHLNTADQPERPIPPHWTKGFAGTLDGECGKEHEVKELDDESERAKHGEIWKHCPLLMYLDGKLIDISYTKETGYETGYLVGNETSDFSILMKDDRNVYVSYKVGVGEDGEDEYAVVRVMAEGDGPAEMWTCHWSVWVCIPNSYASTDLPSTTIGLLGSPDGDPFNDWMNPNGTVIAHDATKNHGTSIEYCHDNWCVPQGKSLMTYPGDTTYDDWKCEQHDYKDYTNNQTAKEECVVGAKHIEHHCQDTHSFYKTNCEYECCHGGPCIEKPVVDPDLILIKFNANQTVPDIIPDHRDCDGDIFYKTAKEVCTDTSEGIVELFHSSDNAPDIFVDSLIYGIILDAEINNDKNGKMVSFKINNSVDDANLYVKHYESYMETFLDPACDATFDSTVGCPDIANPSPDYEIACHEYDGMTSFATFTVFVESPNIANDNKVDDCCLADNPNPNQDNEQMGVHQYSFKILCECPAVDDA